MGTKDEYQFDYLDDNRRFADQINGALFGGRQVVKPEELEPEEAQAVSLGKRDKTGNTRQAYGRCSRQSDTQRIKKDCRRSWKRTAKHTAG